MNEQKSEKRRAVEQKNTGHRFGSLVLKIGIIGILCVIILIGSLHLFGVVQIHRIPRIFTAFLRQAERADITHPDLYERDHFRFSYPTNWTIDTADTNFNPDMFIIIDAPKQGQFRLQIVDRELDARKAVELVADRFSHPSLQVSERHEFTGWGQFQGYGLTLIGKKLGDPVKIRLFSHGGTPYSLIVWEYWLDGPDSINASGFHLIENSFLLQ